MKINYKKQVLSVRAETILQFMADSGKKVSTTFQIKTKKKVALDYQRI